MRVECSPVKHSGPPCPSRLRSEAGVPNPVRTKRTTGNDAVEQLKRAVRHRRSKFMAGSDLTIA